MEHDLKSMSLDALFSLHEVAASGRADTAALIAKFRATAKNSAVEWISQPNFRWDPRFVGSVAVK
jgi:hypothetical protein